MDKSVISCDPDIMSGALCFTGTRVPVKNLFDYLEGDASIEDFLEDFPSIRREQVIAALKESLGGMRLRFPAQLAEFDSDIWDAQIESDAAAGKLDALAEEALAEYAAVLDWKGRRAG